VRKGGAIARQLLIQAAANQWGVPAKDCRAEKGIISHAASGRSISFGKVAGAAAKLTPLADVALKDPKDWKIAGKGVARLDTADKTNGKMVYGIDVKLPGLLNAAIKDCPTFGGRLKSFDKKAIATMPGVVDAVRVGDSAVAVVADSWWRAKKALDTLPIVWDDGPNAAASSAATAAWLAQGLEDSQPAGGGQQQWRRQGGDRRRGEGDRGRLQLSAPESCGDGAAERDRALYARAMRGLDRNAEW
jgi:isoquinoline 1-oxidoreductase beta subunit